MSHHKMSVQDLSFSYSPNQPVLSGVSFQIHHGESVGIIGANGAGKSTLLLLLMGVLFPRAGQIQIGDVLLTPKTLPMIRQRLGLVFQDPDDQLFMPTVYEDVAFGPRNLKLTEDEVDARVKSVLSEVGILDLKDRPPFCLSGGEKRAASIASVLSMAPDILILDEPSSSLDPRTRRRLIGLLKQFGHTKIITSHDLDLILETCERTIVLHQGRIAADGRTADLLSDPSILEPAGLELPLSCQNCRTCNKFKTAGND